MTTATALLPPCSGCGSRAVASGLNARGKRIVVCSSCGHKDVAPVPREPVPVPSDPYWARD